MENIKRDKITSGLLAGSMLQISDPGFNDLIIHKIVQRKRKRAVVNYILSCALLIIVSAALVVLSIPAQQPVSRNVTDYNILGVNIYIVVIDTGSWFQENLFLLLPIVGLFFLKKLIDMKLGNRESGIGKRE
ncbi:MAG: hypothetical protein QM737_23330 [Ferruginibacter sp.]